MMKMRNMTIKSKLTVIMMVASTAVVVLSCTIFIISSFILFKMDHLDKDEVIAELTGRNIQAALMFDVPDDAEKVLSSLAADTSIQFACVYTADGEVFATYSLKGREAIVKPPKLEEEGRRFFDGNLELFYNIRFHLPDFRFL